MGLAWREWIVACSAALLAGTAVGAAQADLRGQPSAPVQRSVTTHESAHGQLPSPQEGAPTAADAASRSVAVPPAQELSAAEVRSGPTGTATDRHGVAEGTGGSGRHRHDDHGDEGDG